ncbi:MAG: hypothetical protein LIO57_04495 [Oscillospiraceae bacterium]|nr:hypothetical protein [Oscillospiraceae bacterium]
MENLLSSLQTADNVCKQLMPSLEEISQIEGEIAAIPEKPRKRKWIILFIVGQFVALLFYGIPHVGSVIGFICRIASVVLSIGGYFYEKKSNAEKKEQLNTKIERIQNRAQQFLNEHTDELSVLPNDYWYPMATDFLVKVVQSGRAGTLGEAIDRYEEQLHRWKVEDQNAQIIAQQQEQVTQLQSIKSSSRVSAAANVANAFINFAEHI